MHLTLLIRSTTRRRAACLLAMAAVLTAVAPATTAAAAAGGSSARHAGFTSAVRSLTAAPDLQGSGPLSAAAAPGPGTGYACQQPPAPGHAACLAITDGVHWNGRSWAAGPAAAARPRTSPPAAAGSLDLNPYMAAGLQAAYSLPSKLLGARQTIAIVDAYDDPDAASDLNAYRQGNGLPACDADFSCFEKVNQDGEQCQQGQGCYPPVDPSGTGGWELEESLDVDMASAICPNCTIILVEANSDSNSDLYAAEDTAAALGANVISDSWGEPEYGGEQADCGHFSHQGVAVTVSSGDSGYGVSFPAACASVTAVGGTTLYQDNSARGWSQTAWAGTGSGCSAYIPKPAWQHDQGCPARTVADVSAVADPATPVAIYDTYGDTGWDAVGGTSVAAPLIAGVYALAGNTATAGPGASWAYAHAGDLSDVTAGFEDAPGADGYCGGSYLCTAGPGYDGPTGLGSPDGIGAF